MAQLSSLEKRWMDLTHEIMELFLSGEGCSGSNKDIISYKPGTIEKINELLARRSEISDLLDRENKQQCRK